MEMKYIVFNEGRETSSPPPSEIMFTLSFPVCNEDSFDTDDLVGLFVSMSYTTETDLLGQSSMFIVFEFDTEEDRDVFHQDNMDTITYYLRDQVYTTLFEDMIKL